MVAHTIYFLLFISYLHVCNVRVDILTRKEKQLACSYKLIFSFEYLTLDK